MYAHYREAKTSRTFAFSRRASQTDLSSLGRVAEPDNHRSDAQLHAIVMAALKWDTACLQNTLAPTLGAEQRRDFYNTLKEVEEEEGGVTMRKVRPSLYLHTSIHSETENQPGCLKLLQGTFTNAHSTMQARRPGARTITRSTSPVFPLKTCQICSGRTRSDLSVFACFCVG